MTLFFFTLVNIAIAYEDFSENHTYQNEVLEQLVTVFAYDEHYDQAEVDAILQRMGVFPEQMLRALINNDVHVYLVDFPITRLPDFAYLSGEVPRGWESTDLTWDDVPGAGGDVVAVRIGYSEPGEGHSSINLEYHELGHAIDYNVLGDQKIHSFAPFPQIHLEERPNLWPDNTFDAPYMDYIEEYFAETLALYYLDGEHRDKLQKEAPKTYTFIEQLPQRIILIEQNDPLGVHLSWEKVHEAVRYDVYRDGIKVASTETASFYDNDFHDHEVHTYDVEAIDDASNVINETLPVDVWTDALVSPSLPTNVTTTIDEKGDVQIEWDDNKTVKQYNVYRNDHIIATVEKPFYIDDDPLEVGVLYEYAIEAENRAGSAFAPGIEVMIDETDAEKEADEADAGAMDEANIDETSDSKAEQNDKQKDFTKRDNIWRVILLTSIIICIIIGSMINILRKR